MKENTPDKTEFRQRIEDLALGMVLGHQLGQWSERKWWSFGQNPAYNELSTSFLLQSANMVDLITSPPVITTPGWRPTCCGDILPHIGALGEEYAREGRNLSPEEFRDFLFRERSWLEPQAVGRTCIELMLEGMNPRIAGLHAPSVLSGCWMAWPLAICNTGFPDDAYEEGVKLSRTQNGTFMVQLNGLLAVMLSMAAVPRSGWPEVASKLLAQAEKRCRHIGDTLKEVFEKAHSCTSVEEWKTEVRQIHQDSRISRHNVDWLADFFIAVSALQYASEHPAGCPEFVEMLLTSCNSRFGVMIGFSLWCAILWRGPVPELWRESLNPQHQEIMTQFAQSMHLAVSCKLRTEGQIASETLLMTEGSPEASTLYDKFLAGMLAGAIGNTMGSPVEDRDYDWIVEKYGVVDKILDTGRLEAEDDSAMAKIWAQTYLQRQGRIYPEDLAEAFRSSMVPEKYYYDSGHAYNLMMEGIPPHACGHWNIVTGSALMGCYPCAMYHAGNPLQAAADARELAYHYQRGFDVHAAAILCAATAEALRPGATVEEVLEAAIEAAPEEKQIHFFHLEKRDAKSYLRQVLSAVEGCQDVLEVRKILYDRFLEYNGQDPWEVVSFTLAIFKVSGGDVWKSMLGGTNIGRDSDTISSQAAILSACIHGMAAVPSELVALFNPSVVEEYKKLALNLVELVRRKRLAVTGVMNLLGV